MAAANHPDLIWLLNNLMHQYFIKNSTTIS